MRIKSRVADWFAVGEEEEGTRARALGFDYPDLSASRARVRRLRLTESRLIFLPRF